MPIYATRGRGGVIKCGRCGYALADVSGQATGQLAEIGGPLTESVTLPYLVRPRPGYQPDEAGVWRPIEHAQAQARQARATRANPPAKFTRTPSRLMAIPELPTSQECLRCRRVNELEACRLGLS